MIHFKGTKKLNTLDPEPMKIWNHPIAEEKRLPLLRNIIIAGFMALVAIHFTLHKLNDSWEISSSQTRIQINLIHQLSEEIKGVQTLYFIWPTVTDPLQKNQIHNEITSHIDAIFQTIRILEYGGDVSKNQIPPDLAHKNTTSQLRRLSPSQHLNKGEIKQLKTNLQTLFGTIEYLHHLLQKPPTATGSEIFTIQQADSSLFSTLYNQTRGLISATKQSLTDQQIIIGQKQSSYRTLEVVLITMTMCTLFILTWWATRQLISSSNILQNTTTYIENEDRRHRALNSILMISMQKSPLQKQLHASLQILLEIMEEDPGDTAGAIFLSDNKKQQIITTVRIGVSEQLSCLSSFDSFSTCLCGQSLHTGKTIHQDNTESCHCSKGKNLCCTPIGPQNNPIGVLMLDLPETKPNHEKMAFLKFVTPILAGIILKSQYEHQLGKSELAALSIFQESQQAILLLRNNEIIDWNNGAATLFKAKDLHTFSAATDIQKLLGNYTGDENPFASHIKTARSEGVSHGELQLCKEDGSLFWAALTFTTIPLHGEHITYLVIHDISTREAEKKALIAAKEEAEKASRAKSTFLATMSHEILTPLNAILGITTLTMNLKLSPETRENLKIIQTSSQSLRVLVTDILDISKIEVDQFTTSSVVFSLKAISKNIQHSFQNDDSNKDIVFTITIDADTPDHLLGDPSRLKQVLDKLITNAFKYTTKGRIDLMIGCKNKTTTDCCLLFTVCDTGIGIDQSNLKTIFDGFTQITAPHSSRYSGAGLGLTISKKIIERMGGSIWVTSSLNQGSTFYIEINFPLHQSLDPSQTTTAKAPSTHLSGKHILVVEDSLINLKVTCQTLKGMGATPLEATNGEEGVTAMHSKIDAVLMDVEMPVLDGIGATKIIRQNPLYNHIPIIAITAHGINEDKKHCFQAGMNDYMTKPMEPEMLLQVISRNITELRSESTGPIDHAAGIKKVGGDQAFFNEILHDFKSLHGNEGKYLQTLFEQENFVEIGERAHRLKGVAGTISALEFSNWAKRLEQQARATTINPIEIEKTIAQLQQCIAEVIATIDTTKANPEHN